MSRAYEAALDYYQYGYNSVTDDNFLSLQDLATSPTRANVTTQFGLYADFFDKIDNYGDVMILDMLNNANQFNGANTAQTADVIKGTLTNIIMYMAVLEKAFGAVAVCRQGNGSNKTDTAVFLFDQAVAFYVGSIEGQEKGGRDGGQLLYSVAKEQCDAFGVCEKGNALVNVAIIQSFTNASVYLTENSCDDAEKTILEEISPAMLVPLIQGTLNYAVVNDGLSRGTQSGSLGTGFAFAQSILPLVNVYDTGSTRTIEENLQFDLLNDPVVDGADTVFQAVKNVIPKMTMPRVVTQCANIGRYRNGTHPDVCEGVYPGMPIASPTYAFAPSTSKPTLSRAPSASPVPATPTTPTDLGLGRYTFINDVTVVAGLALDVRDMQQGSVSDANSTYFNGGNVVVGGGDGGSGVVVSLAELSRTAAIDMNNDPMFNLYRWALLEESVFDKIKTPDFDPLDSAYGDIIVQKALGIATDPLLAAESAVVLSVWMEICHELYNAIDYCGSQDDKTVLSVDRAFALWVGTGQTAESFDDGYLMYSIAQRGARFFGLEIGEAWVNTEIIDLLVQLQKIAVGCKDDSENFLKMKKVVADILKQMTIPLLQNLLHYIDINDVNLIELYALAVVPQAIGCGSSAFLDLRNVLLPETDFNLQNLDDEFYYAMQRFQQCIRISCSDLKGNSSPNSTLLELVDKACYNSTKSSKKLAGFEAVNDVYELSRLDLDILHIEIFMQTKAYGAAEDYYLNGFNSQGTQQPQSLRALAKSVGRSVVPQYETYSKYFDSPDYADDMVQRAIRKLDEFEGASKDQAAEAVTRALQGLVSYMAVLEKLYGAIDQCKQGTGAVERWEEGVALFVGSLEGSEAGGSGAWDGTLLYSLGKETCDAFVTCGGDGDAIINQRLLQVLEDGRNLLQTGDCDGALSVVTDDILSDLPISLVQGILFYVVGNANLKPGNDTYELSSGFILASSVLPLINAVNKTSAQTISNNMDFNLTKQPVPDGVDAVYEAVTFVLTGMDVRCDDIGTYRNRDVCNAAVVSPVVDTPTNLGEGIYTTTTYVEDRAKIAVDLVHIQDALESGNLDLARIIYREGENSKIYDENGIETGHRSLQKFSTEDSKDMIGEPLFNIFRYSLQDSNGQYLGVDARLYADSIVNKAFTDYSTEAKTLAAEAMLAINLWMYLVHQLFETLGNCKNKVVADADGVHSIDEAVAYWIGDGQIAGDGDRGHLFYALAERMGDKFQVNVNGQSRTNVNILRLFNQAKLELSFPDACSTNPNTYSRLRQIVYRILTQMTIPLMQSLIDSLRENDNPRVQMYAQAVTPLIAACDPTLYEYLHLKLIGGDYNVIEVEDIIGKLRTSFECLGISCSDVGRHISETDNTCVDTPKTNAFAGYVPNNDVREYAQLDLDILESQILMEMAAYDAVEDLYTYGKHAVVDGMSGPEMLSLSQLATTSDRSVVPQFDTFVRFYGDDKYADSIILTALDKSKLSGVSDEQRKEIVVKIMQCLVVYMSALQAMYDTVSGCQSGDTSRMLGAREAWDRAAALMIGSIEGSKDGGSEDGQFLYALAKEQCASFNTCGAEGFSSVNEELLSLLYTGQGEVAANSCNSLTRTVTSIESLLLVPLIQSTLHAAVVNSKLAASPTEGSFGDGYVYSRSVLPLVQSVDRDAADVINRNMDLQFTSKPVVDGAIAVFNAFADAYVSLEIDCKKIGSIEGIDSCTGVQVSQASASSNAGAIAGIIIGIMVVLGLVTFLVFRKRQRMKGEEQAPMFKRAKNGVMNHDSDILGGKLDDASITDGDEAFVRRLQVEADAMSMT